jgi:hypothetical protein
MSGYFITGLPRSRTTWLAAYLTAASMAAHERRHICYHEPKFPTPEWVAELVEGAGISCTLSGLLPTRRDAIMSVPMLYIMRSIWDVAVSLSRQKFNILEKGGSVLTPHDWQDRLQPVSDKLQQLSYDHPRCMVVGYKYIDTYLEQITEHLLGVGVYDHDLAEEFKKYHITDTTYSTYITKDTGE